MSRMRVPVPKPGVFKSSAPAAHKSGSLRLRDGADPQLAVTIEIDGRDYIIDVLEDGCPRLATGDIVRLVRPAVANPFGDMLLMEADGLVLDDEIDLDGDH